MPARRRWPKWIAVAGLILLLAGYSVWRWNATAVVTEATGPDWFDFGQLQLNATVEFNAKFLTSPSRRPLDVVWESMTRLAPKGWQSWMNKMHPKNRRQALLLSPEQLAALKPTLTMPPSVELVKIEPEQNARWFGGRPFFVGHFRLNTSQPGYFTNLITLKWKERQASLPIRYTVATNTMPAAKLLVVHTPFDGYGAEEGTAFLPTVQLFSNLNCRVDCLEEIPLRLDEYAVVLVGDDAMASLSAPAAARLQRFAEGGGRLVLTCNAFFRSTVANANRLLAPHGIQVVDKDYGRFLLATNVVDDPITRGVKGLAFFRPALIQQDDGGDSNLLVRTDAGTGGFLARAQVPQGGEIYVLSTSLWWHWMTYDSNQLGNTRLLENLLQR